jgi:hypothetical protein
MSIIRRCTPHIRTSKANLKIIFDSQADIHRKVHVFCVRAEIDGLESQAAVGMTEVAMNKLLRDDRGRILPGQPALNPGGR